MSKRKAALVERSAKRVPPWARGKHRDRLERLRTLVPASVLWHKPTARHRANIRALDTYLFGGGRDQPRAFSKDKRAYKPKRADRLHAAQHYSGIPENLARMMNSAIMPDLGIGTRYSFKKDGGIRITSGHLVRDFRPIDEGQIFDAAQESARKHEGELLSEEQALANLKAGYYDDDFLARFIDHVGELIEHDPPDTLYHLGVGEDGQHAFAGWDGIAMGKEALISTLIRMFAMYHDDIGKWLVGITIYTFRDQEGASGFDDPQKLEELAKAIERKKAKKKAKKKRTKNRPGNVNRSNKE